MKRKNWTNTDAQGLSEAHCTAPPMWTGRVLFLTNHVATLGWQLHAQGAVRRLPVVMFHPPRYLPLLQHRQLLFSVPPSPSPWPFWTGFTAVSIDPSSL